MSTLARRSPRQVSLPAFFGLTYLLSWLVWVPLVLSRFRIGPFWLFDRTRSSILLVVAFHLSFNMVNTVLLPVTLVPTAYGLFIGLQGLLFAVAAARNGRRAATRGESL